MKHKVYYFVGFFQSILLKLAFPVFKLFTTKEKGCVIGVSEMAKMIFLIGNIIPDAKTVCLDENKFFNLNYDYRISKVNKYLYAIKRVIYGPILLAYLSNKYDVFIYLWSTGFLLDRDFDYRFLSKKNRKIVTIFVGDDIRSPVKLGELLKELEYDGFLEYVGAANPHYLTSDYEERKKRIAELSDKYSDICFSLPVDQASYLKSKQYFLPFAYDRHDFNRNDAKFLNIKKVKVLHAPSNPLVKGTPLVRAAVKKLQEDGYDFEYKELIDVPNQQVLSELRDSHVVLNQFYAFAPGVFGIEAMANHCAVLMSADFNIETELPQSAKGAWLITGYWQIYDNLKFLLDHPSEIKKFADTGYEFALNNYSYENASESIMNVFTENGIDL